MLYNPKPRWGKIDGRGWKTINGAINEAHELSTCLGMNARLWGGFSVGVTVHINATLPEQEVKSLWAFVCRNLKRAGIVAFWRREVSPNHRVHYHLLLVTRHAEDELDALIEEAFPESYRSRPGQARRKITVAFRYDNDRKAANYVTKAKVPGYTEAGGWVKDYYRFKRTFFLPHVKLRAVGVIGPFWRVKKEDLWKEVIQHERDLEKKVTPQLIAEAEDILEAFGPILPLPALIRHLAKVELADDKRTARLKPLTAPVSTKTPPVIVSVTLPCGTTVNAPVIPTVGGADAR